MDDIRNLTAIGPQAYERWRATFLGNLTETLEERLVLALIGDLSNTRILDAGCGDGALLCAGLAAAGVGATLVEGRVEQLRALAAQAGLSITASRGAVFYPPVGMIARILAPLDVRLGRFTTLGAAFIAVSAVKA